VSEYPNREQGKRMLEAIGDLAGAIYAHNMDRDRREKVRVALRTLIDEVLIVAARHHQEQTDD
jgi:hypothetical protein